MADAPRDDHSSPDANADAALTLTAHAALPSDADRGVVRIDPADLAAANIQIGDVVALTAQRAAYARILPAPPRFRGQGIVMMDGMLRDNAGATLGEPVTIARVEIPPADQVRLSFDEHAPTHADPFAEHVAAALDSVPVAAGDRLRLRLIGGQSLMATVGKTAPDGAVLITGHTQFTLTAPEPRANAKPPRKPANAPLGYEDLGGLAREIARVREIVELPLRNPQLFAHLGVEPPRGVLLSGPPGTGKTLLARAVANESKAAFFQINGPEIVSKHYGESEAQLRDVFTRAGQRDAAVVFIDEIDAIAPKREALSGDRQVERRIVGQLLTLLDGMDQRSSVIVMAATNLPDSLDPALRRPGRFDREIAFGAPDVAGRREILDVHTRGMPLADDVDLDTVAAATHGYVGADLAALAREAAMAALRRITNNYADHHPALNDLHVTARDIDAALTTVSPSAIREVFTETPGVTWEDVGGCDTIKDRLVETAIWPLAHADAFARLNLSPPRGVLLAGPPGTGKTHIAKALATEAGANFISIRGPQLLSKYVGEAEAAVKGVFDKARLAAPCVVFFDEVDAIAPARGSGDGAVVDRVVATLLMEMDGLEDRRGVFVLGATNRPDRMDPALLRPGRFDLVLETPLPDTAARAQILAILTRNTPLSEEVALADIAAQTEGFSGAELNGLVAAAGRNALRAALRTPLSDSPGAPTHTPHAASPDAPLHAPQGENLQELVVCVQDFDAALRDWGDFRAAPSPLGEG